ncbi:MAG: LLM class flavin-dependent oxidoreductase [Acidimicrobiia bacterium]
MRFGLFLQPVHPTSEDPTVALERDLDLVVLLDKLGYDEAWVGEHHSTGWENIASPEIFIASAAERTGQIRLGTGVVQLGLHHPLVAVDRMILLDHLTRGRVMFGVGVGGGLPSDLRVFGLTREEAGRRLEESLDVILRLLESDEPVDEKTDWFELHRATLQLGPYTKPHPPFAMATTDRRNVELMGRLGGQILTGPIPKRVPDLVEHLQRGASAAGLTASSDQVTLSYAMHLATTREKALSQIRDGAIAEHYEFNVKVNGAPAPSVSPDEWFESYVDRHVVGTVDDAIEKIEGLLELSGGFGGLLFTSRDWAGTKASRESWELFARSVAPRFRGRLTQQKAAAATASDLNAP